MYIIKNIPGVHNCVKAWKELHYNLRKEIKGYLLFEIINWKNTLRKKEKRIEITFKEIIIGLQYSNRTAAIFRFQGQSSQLHSSQQKQRNKNAFKSWQQIKTTR